MIICETRVVTTADERIWIIRIENGVAVVYPAENTPLREEATSDPVIVVDIPDLDLAQQELAATYTTIPDPEPFVPGQSESNEVATEEAVEALRNRLT